MRSSPWWYRYRALVFFSIYYVGFAGWYALPASHGHEALPSFIVLARALHWSSFALAWTATAVTLAGALVRLWGSSYLQPDVVWNPNAVQSRLLVDGPFRYVRNPLYLGSFVMAFGIGSLAPIGGWIVIVLLAAAFSAMLARHESNGMRERYGAVYDAYAATVPAFVPRLFPARVEGSVLGKPSITAGIRAEAYSFGFAAGMLAFTVSGYDAWLWGFFIGGAALQLLLRRL